MQMKHQASRTRVFLLRFIEVVVFREVVGGWNAKVTAAINTIHGTDLFYSMLL